MLGWMTVSSWYFESWDSVYFDILYTDSILQRFKIIVKPDLSDASLQFINTMSEIVSDDLMESLTFRGYIRPDFVDYTYRICEDALVYFWSNHKKWGAYAGLISAPFTDSDVVTQWNFGPPTSAPFVNLVTGWDGHVVSLCPTSGRSIHCPDDSDRIVVVDLF